MDEQEVTAEAEVLVEQALEEINLYPDSTVAERARALLLARLRGN